jgi:hypothetical protein
VAHAENSIEINASAAKVFAFLADGSNNPKWRPSVLKVEAPAGPPALGSIYKQTLKGPGGRAIAGDYKITDFDPNTTLAFAVITGPARPTGRFMIVPQTNSTRVTFILDYPLTGLKKLIMDKAVTTTMQSEVANLAQLKAVLEA